MENMPQKRSLCKNWEDKAAEQTLKRLRANQKPSKTANHQQKLSQTHNDSGTLGQAR